MTKLDDESPNNTEVEGSSGAARSMIGENVAQLVEDVRHLSTYAIQTGQLPDGVDIQQIYVACGAVEQHQGLSAAQFEELVNYYQILERHFPTITARHWQPRNP